LAVFVQKKNAQGCGGAGSIEGVSGLS